MGVVEKYCPFLIYKGEIMYYINGNLWVIMFVPRDTYILAGHIGMCDYDMHSIFVADDLDYYEMQEVVQHEVAHSISFEAGIPANMREEDLALFCGKYSDEIHTISDNAIYHFLENH